MKIKNYNLCIETEIQRNASNSESISTNITPFMGCIYSQRSRLKTNDLI